MKKKAILGFLFIATLGLGSVFLLNDENGNMFASLVDKKEEMVTLETNYGDIKIKLFHDKAPNMANNFQKLAEQGKYDDTVFHRVIDGFMIQGGDYENGDGTGGESWQGGVLKDEFGEGLSNVRGMVSMANYGRNTNGSQFFILQEDAKYLDGRHSVFGEVVEGMDVVDKISKVRTDLNDKPLGAVEIRGVSFE